MCVMLLNICIEKSAAGTPFPNGDPLQSDKISFEICLQLVTNAKNTTTSVHRFSP